MAKEKSEAPELAAKNESPVVPAQETPKTLHLEIVRFGRMLTDGEREVVARLEGEKDAAGKAPPTPPDGPGTFRCSWSDKSATIEGDNSRDAWAKFCDSIKTYPSPKAGKVERVS